MTAQKFVTECSQSGLKIEAAILFGSHAQNRQSEHSDIDLALVSSDFGKNFLDNNHKTSKVNIRFPDIEVHHFNKDYFEKGDPFIDEINKTGIKLAID